MKYESPAIFDLDELAESVYATGSGMEDCWTINYSSPQSWNGSAKVFEIKCSHTKSAWHTSKGLIATLYFDRVILNAYAENSTDYKVESFGNGIRVTRELHGNGYFSGDEVTFKIFVSCKSQEETEATTIINKSIQCIKG